MRLHWGVYIALFRANLESKQQSVNHTDELAKKDPPTGWSYPKILNITFTVNWNFYIFVNQCH